MKFFLLLLLCFFSPLGQAQSERSHLLQTTITVFQGDKSLSDLFDDNGQSQLCLASTLTYAMKFYLKDTAPADDHETIRRFFKETGSNRNGAGFGSSIVNNLLGLYTHELKVEPFKFYSNDVSSVDDTKKRIINSIMDSLDQNKMIIMHISWWSQLMDGSVTSLGSQGGHVVNVIGYSWKEEFKYDRIELKIHDPMKKYLKGQSYDHVMMKIAHSQISPVKYEIPGLQSLFNGGIPYLGMIVSPK